MKKSFKLAACLPFCHTTTGINLSLNDEDDYYYLEDNGNLQSTKLPSVLGIIID